MDRDAPPTALEPVEGAGSSARKASALELFSGLPRRYDALSAAFETRQHPLGILL